MGSTFRTSPFPDFQVLDFLVYVAAFGTGLTASEPLVNFDKIVALVF